MENWNKLPFIVRTAISSREGGSHSHYFSAFRDALAFCDYLAQAGIAFSITW